MSRILVLGIGPLALDDTRMFHAGGNRAWSLSKALLDSGHDVMLICMRVTEKDAANQPDEEIKRLDALTYISCDETRCFANDAYLREKIREFAPSALVGACDYPAARACAVADRLPVWADIHGYPMGEAQAKAYHYREPGYLHHFWNIHRQALLRGDRFSVTSERQRMALIGELGAMGRLNGDVFCEELVQAIPISWDAATPFQPPAREKDDPFTVFFCGGYNLWCDVETLFQALEIAMRRDARIRFLSSGGAIDGHDEKTYPRFKAMVEQSEMRERFDLRGWVKRETLETLYQQAHLGINADLPCYETLIGARNRITEFIARGLPTLTTLGTEISQILYYKAVILTAPMRNPQALAGEMILAANHPEKMRAMSKQARKVFEQFYTESVASAPLVEWCANPSRSGDADSAPIQLDYRRFPLESEPPTPGTLKRILRRIGLR